MTENLTKQYDGYAVYLPSLQSQYANYATKTNSQINRAKSCIPKKYENEWLNFLNKESKLWHCGYALYSCGQFDKSQIRTRDIVAERNWEDCTIVGDSGGFQLGTGAINSKAELEHLERYKNNADKQYANWHKSGFRERTLKWLDRYCDYSMSLDMVLWAAESYNQPNARNSQLRKLTINQLIDLSVDNLRYFADNRGRSGKGTKILNVLQDIGNGTGDAWYDAVKDFDFEGWALGSETGGLLNSMKWMRKLLYEKKLDSSEWVHTLGKSPPINSVVYTAAQRALRKALGKGNFTISLDSSSPHQLAGKQRRLVVPSKFTADKKSWRISSWQVKQDIRIARNQVQMEIPFASPLSKFMSINDFMAHDINDSDYFTDTWAEQCFANHNLYTYHRISIDACDLVFGNTKKKDLKRVPDELIEAVDLIELYFEAENVGKIEERLAVVLSPFFRAGKDKSHDDSDEIVDFEVS